MATDRNDPIDERDPAFRFGQIMTRLDSQHKSIEGLLVIADEIRKAIGALPCDINTHRIEDLEEWQKEKRNANREAARAGVSFRAGLILVLVSVFTSATIGSIVSVLLK